MRVPSTLRSCAGPLAFAVATVVGGRRISGYSARDEPISAIASRGSPGASVMIPGFVALGVGTIDLARKLTKNGRAPTPVRQMLVLAGVTTIGAGLARCSSRACPSRFLGDRDATISDELHGVCSMTTFVLWITIPLVSARSASKVDPAYARRAQALSAVTFIAWAATGALTTRRSTRWQGLAQRLMAVAALAWYPLATHETTA